MSTSYAGIEIRWTCLNCDVTSLTLPGTDRSAVITAAGAASHAGIGHTVRVERISWVQINPHAVPRETEGTDKERFNNA